MRAIDFLDEWNKTHTSSPSFQDAIDWTKKEVVKDACKWFADYLMEIGHPDDWLRDSPNIESGEKRFIKAMEG